MTGTVGGDSTATSHGLAGSGLGNRVKMLEMYKAGGDQANTVVTQPRLSQLNLPKLAREVLILRTYRAAPVRLLLGTGPIGLHQAQLGD